MQPDLSLVYRMCEAFNARDIESVLATMTPDVDWPDGWMGGRVQGHESVRADWIHQWENSNLRLMPVGFTLLGDGRLRVEVQQVVLDREGNRLSEGTIGHAYTFRDGLIAKMDVE